MLKAKYESPYLLKAHNKIQRKKTLSYCILLLITSTRTGIIFAGINSNQYHIFLTVKCQGFVSKQKRKVPPGLCHVILPERGYRFTCQICKQNILDNIFQFAEYLTLDNSSSKLFVKNGNLLPL